MSLSLQRDIELIHKQLVIGPPGFAMGKQGPNDHLVFTADKPDKVLVGDEFGQVAGCCCAGPLIVPEWSVIGCDQVSERSSLDLRDKRSDHRKVCFRWIRLVAMLVVADGFPDVLGLYAGRCHKRLRDCEQIALITKQHCNVEAILGAQLPLIRFIGCSAFADVPLPLLGALIWLERCYAVVGQPCSLTLWF